MRTNVYLPWWFPSQHSQNTGQKSAGGTQAAKSKSPAPSSWFPFHCSWDRDSFISQRDELNICTEMGVKLSALGLSLDTKDGEGRNKYKLHIQKNTYIHLSYSLLNNTT